MSSNPPTSAASTKSSASNTIVDDKSPHCIPFILSHLSSHTTTPFIIGLNGIQGAGKTTLVSTLSSTLRSHGYTVAVLSIDDLYLTRTAQTALAEAHKENKLLQHRGEPGTHDLVLAAQVFDALKEGRTTRVPYYDKSAFGGKGDRAPEDTWEVVNGDGQPKVQVVILEGWCVGFRSLPVEVVRAKYAGPSKTLRKHKVEDLLLVNDNLKAYAVMTDSLDVFIHIDAGNTEWVYEWREEQEEKLRLATGRGMTKEQVIEFVDGYFPAYELYEEGIRNGVFEEKGKQLRLVVGMDRRITDVAVM